MLKFITSSQKNLRIELKLFHFIDVSIHPVIDFFLWPGEVSSSSKEYPVTSVKRSTPGPHYTTHEKWRINIQIQVNLRLKIPMQVMISWYNLWSRNGGPTGILRMLAVLISDTQTTTKTTNQRRDTNGNNGFEKTAEI